MSLLDHSTLYPQTQLLNDRMQIPVQSRDNNTIPFLVK